ncbi:Rha family transcriptional regulator [Xanthomonas campestris pv. campestris]|uniref:DNA-binding protein n=1 Tax=Xanthomonas campestris TaxID=339 RepID=UPI00279B9304|nr:Rha family transcriptional regulator [Xanthomonas campestris pv. campestris]
MGAGHIAGDAPAITSRDISDMVNSQHDSVKRTIQRLATDGVIQLPPMVDAERINGLGLSQSTALYFFSGEQGKRDSIVVVAQLSPEFTARLVDRWQQLERRVTAPADPLALLSDPAALRGGRHVITSRYVGGRGLCGANSEERQVARSHSAEIFVEPGQVRSYRIHTRTEGESTIEPVL